ncbi:hypothetical protein K435DRAFT_881637 [Dendrothele bispora CBS 962.96]|uniref:CxC5 like cysteine cluster associated with KDZ domain-containing protein n=1 Tax=Dendrothele bispora (strain CBS 962.96) TaxID=1314807 RepID=A0A4S8KI61_DENBC|nr:hypothetical protein K435DRAFT_881637 [Dendrothele bispora CBS 962.96]
MEILSKATHNASNLLISQLMAFLVLCSYLKRNVLLLYPSSHLTTTLPPILPRETRAFLGESTNMDPEDVEASSKATKDFNIYSKLMGRLSICLWPPNQHCINTDCPYVKKNKPLKLQSVKEISSILYTVSMGQLTCEGCKVVYYPDYFVKKDLHTNERFCHYYDVDMTPTVLQVATHHFVETALARSWRNSMLYGA